MYCSHTATSGDICQSKVGIFEEHISCYLVTLVTYILLYMFNIYMIVVCLVDTTLCLYLCVVCACVCVCLCLCLSPCVRACVRACVNCVVNVVGLD